jgi:hypothetical protein
MTVTMLLTEPVDLDGDDDENHVFCCNPNLALCGVRIDDYELFEPDEDDSAELCEKCRWLEALNGPCGALLCRLRGRLRRRWSR